MKTRVLWCQIAVLCFGLLCPRSVRALPEADFRRFTDWLWLLGGVVTGFVAHEGGHLMLDFAVDAKPEFRPVSTGPFPFFAIQPSEPELSPRLRYAIPAAGLSMQNLYSELILRIDPRLREHHHPFLKGMLGFHVVLSVGYAITGFASVGPSQSDVLSMSRASGIPPYGMGLLLLVPAGCDLYRYFVPDSRWAPWVSLTGKLTLVGAAAAF
ncbi:MAG TPA: hypothetical protein PKE31_17425 [Pseudomonadota bacterium]|nr:hypothetical protein [Pseudomonadota bacterium]